MSSEHSVTQAIYDLRDAGNEAAAQKLFEKYAGPLLERARAKLKAKGGKRRVVDEDDVVQSALESFCRRHQAGMFPKVTDRESLWPLLLTITERKATKVAVRERRVKRGGGRVQGESALVGLNGEEEALAERAIGKERTPQEEAESTEAFERLLDLLKDDGLRAVALGNLKGYSTEEIACRLRCGVRTVKQKRALIRKLWENEVK